MANIAVAHTVMYTLVRNLPLPFKQGYMAHPVTRPFVCLLYIRLLEKPYKSCI